MLSGLGATQLPITLMEALHPLLLLAPFMENIMSLSAWPLRQNEREREGRDSLANGPEK